MIENYEVNITRYAYGQMNDIRRYIEEEFHSAESAKKLLLAMKDSIGGLQHMPSRYQLVEEEPWRTEGIHRLIVHNFNIYYWIEESAAIVHVTAVVYGKRNQIQQLSAMDKL